MIFPTKVNRIPCQVQVTHFTPGCSAQTMGPPESCHEGEPSELEFQLLDRRGRHAPWLERYLTDEVVSEIEEDFRMMRMAQDYDPY